MPEDRGADLSSALEVNQSPNADPMAPASAGHGEGGDPDPNQRENDDRKALNFAKEAQKDAKRLRAKIEEIQSQQTAILTSLATQNGASAPEPATTPYSAKELSIMLQSGDYETYQQAMEENYQFRRDQDRQSQDRALNRRDQGTKLNEYLLRELGLANADSDVTQKIEEEMREVRKKFPDLDEANATVVAAGAVWSRIARGELEVDDDLRSESVRRANQPNPVPPSPTPAQTPKVNWDATNRGLSEGQVRQLERFRLGKVLKKHSDPEIEQEYREAILDILGHEAERSQR